MHVTDNPATPPADAIDFDAFRKVDIRAGKVIEAAPLEGARKPALRLLIDFGEGVGVKKSSAQITENYTAQDMLGRTVLAVVNFPPRQTGKFMSEVLTLGVPDENGHIVLCGPDQPTPNGARLV